MKKFIDTFFSKHSEAKAKVENEIFKLVLNSAFGKMCEGLCNRIRCDLSDPKNRFESLPIRISYLS